MKRKLLWGLIKYNQIEKKQDINILSIDNDEERKTQRTQQYIRISKNSLSHESQIYCTCIHVKKNKCTVE